MLKPIRTVLGTRARRSLLAFLVAVTPGYSSSALAAYSRVDTAQSVEGLNIFITWPNPPSVETAVDGRDLLIHFSSPLKPEPFLELPGRAADWIANVETGYDSVLVRAAADVVFKMTRRPDGVVINMRRGATANVVSEDVAITPGSAEVDRVRKRQKLRAELLLARALMDSASYARARAILQQQINKNPTVVEPHLALAELETRTGRWPLAVALYNRSLALVQDPSVAQAKSNLLYQHGQKIGTEIKYLDQQNSSTQRQAITQGRLFATNEDIVGIEHEVRDVRPTPKNGTPPGNTSNGHSLHNRLNLYATRVLADGQELTGTLYTTPESVGGGLATGAEMFDGQSTVSLAYHQPYWESLESLSGAGVVDRATLQHKREIVPGLVNMEFGAGYNNYSLIKSTTSTDTASFGGAVRMTPKINEGSISVGYVLDAEYGLSNNSTTTTNAVALPKTITIGSREFHTAELGYNREWTDYLSTEAAVTYTYDRVSNGKGPGTTVGVTYRPSSPWELGLRYGLNLISSTAAGAGGKVTWGSAVGSYHF